MKLAKEIIVFSVFEVIFCTMLVIVLVFHGPFTNIRDTWVTTAMTTLNHQYLAKLFLSQEEIDKIMQKNQQILSEVEDVNSVFASKGTNNITITNINGKFKGYLMTIDNPARVKVGVAEIGKSGLTLSAIVKKYNAVGGINAGGFSDDYQGAGTGANPEGVLISNNQTVYIGKGEVHTTETKTASTPTTNTKYDPETQVNNDPKKQTQTKSENVTTTTVYDIIGFNKNNVLVIGRYTLDQIRSQGIRDAVSFGPGLIINGKPMIVSGNGGWGIQPRTAIGQKKDGTVLLLVVDGRQTDSIGATLRDIQDVLLEYGAYNAANLDGGSSATMVYNGSVINKPCDILGERSIPSAFIVE